MASESVGILIEADDQASAKLQRVADNVDRQVKRIKETGQKAKASTEFVGTLANSLGGTQLGGFTSDLAHLTERISAFSEVSKAGGAGALAFKAGLAAATAITSFQVGKTIGEWAFETQRWREELQASAAEAQKLEAAFAKLKQKEFSQKRDDLGLINDPKERIAATLAEADRLAKEAGESATIIGLAQDEVARRQKAFDKTWLPESNEKEELGTAKRQLQEKIDKRNVILEEAQALKEIAELEQKRLDSLAAAKSTSFIEGLREELAMTKATKEERFALEAAKNTNSPAAQKEAEAMLRQLDALKEQEKAKEELRRKEEQAKQKAEADAQRVADIQKREIEHLEERRIAIEQGAEAARAYSLEQQGLDKATAQKLAAKESELDRKEAMRQQAGPLSATQGRLLTGGRGSADPIQKATEKTAKYTEEAAQTLIKMHEEARKKKTTTVEIVG